MTPKEISDNSFATDSLKTFEKECEDRGIKVNTSEDGKRKKIELPVTKRAPGMLIK